LFSFSLTAFASENGGSSEEKTVFEQNLEKYFVKISGYEGTYKNIPGYNDYSYKHVEFSEPVYVGWFTNDTDPSDGIYTNMLYITDSGNEVEWGSVIGSFNEGEDEILSELKMQEVEKNSSLVSEVSVDGKIYRFTVYSCLFLNPVTFPIPMYRIEHKYYSNPAYWQEVFGDPDFNPEWEGGLKPIPERDEELKLVNFKADEWVRASWDGTTYDSDPDKLALYDDITYEVRFSYARVGGRPDDIQEEEIYTRDGVVSTGSWSRKQSLMEHENEQLYLRYVKFTPLAHKGNMTTRGYTHKVSFLDDGTEDPREDEMTYIRVDDFDFIGLSVEDNLTGLIAGDIYSKISWSGTTYDLKLDVSALDDAYAIRGLVCYDVYNRIVIHSYEELIGEENFTLRKEVGETDNSFKVNVSDVKNKLAELNLVWSGELTLTPVLYYEPHNTIYEGRTSYIDLYKNEIEQEDPNPDPLPSESPEPGGGAEDDDSDPIPDFDDDLDPDNALEWFWKLLKNLYSQLGQLPTLMYNLFPFIPKEIYYFLGAILVIVVIMRILGR